MLRRHIVLIVVMAGVAFVFLAPVFPWSIIAFRSEEVDLRSGRVRRTQTVFGAVVSERIEETWVSQAIDRPPGPPDWRRVNTFAFGAGHSPHYVFHSAITQVQTLAMIDELLPFDAVTQTRVASELLDRWQRAESDEVAQRYIEELWRLVRSRLEEGAVQFTVDDLP